MSLLGRMLGLFPESARLEDMFTEAVAHLFETKPQLCLEWLEEAGLVSTPHAASAGERKVAVSSQKWFTPLKHHGMASRPDLFIEIYRPLGKDMEEEAVKDVVMVESKIDSREGQEQLRRYAGHLDAMTGVNRKTLLYITQNDDPKDPGEILSGLAGNVRFEQLRWYDFYRFLQMVEQGELVEEIMTFMEEQGMSLEEQGRSRSPQFLTTEFWRSLAYRER